MKYSSGNKHLPLTEKFIESLVIAKKVTVLAYGLYAIDHFSVTIKCRHDEPTNQWYWFFEKDEDPKLVVATAARKETASM